MGWFGWSTILSLLLLLLLFLSVVCILCCSYFFRHIYIYRCEYRRVTGFYEYALNVQRIRKRKYFGCIACTRSRKKNPYYKLSEQKQRALTITCGCGHRSNSITKQRLFFHSIHFVRYLHEHCFRLCFSLTCCCWLLLFFPLVRNSFDSFEYFGIFAIQTQF